MQSAKSELFRSAILRFYPGLTEINFQDKKREVW